MNALSIENATRRIAPPDNWDHEKNGICHTLEILDQDGYMISAWQPSPSELKRLNEGKPILLFIKGTIHPIVGLAVQKET